jgi:hypothetical protein
MRYAKSSGEYEKFLTGLYDLAASRLPLAQLPRVIEERKEVVKGNPSQWAARIMYSTASQGTTPCSFFAFNAPPQEGGDSAWNEEEAVKVAAWIEKLAATAAGDKEGTSEEATPDPSVPADGTPADGGVLGDATEKDPDVARDVEEVRGAVCKPDEAAAGSGEG